MICQYINLIYAICYLKFLTPNFPYQPNFEMNFMLNLSLLHSNGLTRSHHIDLLSTSICALELANEVNFQKLSSRKNFALKFPWNRSAMKYERYKSDFKMNFAPLCPHFSSKQYLMGLISIVFTFCLACVAACSRSVPHDVAYFVVNSGALFKVKVVYFGVLTQQPLKVS